MRVRRRSSGGPYDGLVERLQAEATLRSAARIARTFRLDPLLVLDDPDEFRWAVRVAAHNVIAQDEKDAADKSKSSSRVAGRKGRG